MVRFTTPKGLGIRFDRRTGQSNHPLRGLRRLWIEDEDDIERGQAEVWDVLLLCAFLLSYPEIFAGP